MKIKKNIEYIDNLRSGDNVIWETHRVSLTKVPVFGFGIAVSGGADSPHFANGDPSIAISDVLKAGPAEARLQVNDRIITVNGISLENVDHATAISVLRDSGNTVNLVVRRRIVLPTGLETETPPLKVTLSRKSKKDDYGIVLGCKFFIKEVQPHSLAAQEGALKEGDTVLKINNTQIDSLSLTEAKKLIEKTKEKLQLIITKKKSSTPSTGIDDRHKRQNSQLKEEEILSGYASLRRQQDKDDVNIYRPSVRSEDDIYKPGTLPNDVGLPPGAYPPNSEHARFDGRYVLDNDAPPRPPLPSGFDEVSPSTRSPVHRKEPRGDGYYSDSQTYPRRETRLDDDRRVPNMGEDDDDVFGGPRHEERYVGLRKDIRPEPRSVSFIKDRTFGLGLSLAGGNATGIFIASVQPGSAAEREGLSEGDQILHANEQEITGLTREEAVAFLKSLDGQVIITVQYRKEEYDRIMASHEAGDSFYVKTHFQYDPQEAGDHGFSVGEIFHVKDTLFRRESESWLAVKLGKNNQESKKGTIPNKKRSEVLSQTQQQSNTDKENFPNKGRGSLFKRKAARRAKSLGKDHWEEVIFSEDGAGLSTKFPPYERVMLREASFVRPVVIFGAVADVARERLLQDFAEKFESPQTDSGSEEDRKNKSGIIRLGAIREAITKRKHCLLDLTPHHVDRLNYAQYYPIVVYLKAEGKQAVKDIRGRWKGPASKSQNPKKAFEHNEKLEKMYSHLFTGTVSHTSSDNWYLKLCDLIAQQQRQHVWMSEIKPEEDISDDFLFPMPARLSYAPHDNDDHHHRPYDDFDVSPIQKKRLVRSSSDPSVNTAEHGIPGIPPYPAPPSYHNQKLSPQERYMQGNDPRGDYRPRENEWHGTRPEDRYYPSYYADHSPNTHHSRANIDPYATLTPSERLRNRIASDTQYTYDDYNRFGSGDVYRAEPTMARQLSPLTSPHSMQRAPQEQRAHNDSSSHSSDSYSKYLNHGSNKHDDSKLREKISAAITGRERSPGHDPYRFTRSTANPANTGNVNKAKISDLTAKYRKEEPSRSPQGRPETQGRADTQPRKKKEPPPVPVKTFLSKDRGSEPDEQKIRNYENSNRSYNYSEVNTSPHRGGDRYPPPPDMDQYPPNNEPSRTDQPYEYVAIRGQNSQPRDLRHRSDTHLDRHADYNNDRYRDNTYDRNAKAFANAMYMDHREIERLRAAKHAGRSPEHFPSPEGSYSRPRTDEEEMAERSFQNMKTRAKSEPGLNDLTNPTTKTSKHISWALDNRKENFESYKRLITPGFYGTRRSISSSQELLDTRDRSPEKPPPPAPAPAPAPGPETRGSAFETYRKSGAPPQSANMSPSRVPQNGRPVVESIKKGPRPPPPTLPPPPPVPPPLKLTDTPFPDPPKLSDRPPTKPTNNQNGGSGSVNKRNASGQGNGNEAIDSESEAIVNESEATSSDSLSTPDTVIMGSDFNQDTDERHTVVASARGVFDSEGGVLESRETGVSIVIPKGALPGEGKQEIYFKVCRDNSILPPLDKDKGETLLSPLVMCGPHGLKFNTPVELRLPHCASVNPESWSFALKSSDSPSGQPTKWQNMSLAGMEGVTQGQISKNSVSVLVDHF